jgi:D-3-phosphoglycerate dehydrogenase
MTHKVLLTADMDPGGIQLLKSNGCEVINEEGKKITNVAHHIGDCDGVITRIQLIDEAVFKAGKQLKVVGKHGVGIDCIDVEAATRHGIQVVNAPESNNESVAEHTLAFILALMKKTLVCHNAVVSGNFHIRDTLEIFQVKDKILGIVGLGRIGKKVALKAKVALGMRVLAYDPYQEKDPSVPGIENTNSLEEVLSQADIVTLHLPLTNQTRHLFGVDEFKKMKNTAYLINMARGPVVSDAALVEALKNKIIAGAALDVFEHEPPPDDSELLSMDNVVFSPHNAALTKEALEKMSLHAAMGVIDILKGKIPTWPVNQLS